MTLSQGGKVLPVAGGTSIAARMSASTGGLTRHPRAARRSAIEDMRNATDCLVSGGCSQQKRASCHVASPLHESDGA